MLYVARGTALLISGGSTYPNLGGQPALGNTGFSYLGNGRPLGLPFSIWVMIALALATTLLLDARRRSGAGSTPPAATSGPRSSPVCRSGGSRRSST